MTMTQNNRPKFPSQSTPRLPSPMVLLPLNQSMITLNSLPPRTIACPCIAPSWKKRFSAFVRPCDVKYLRTRWKNHHRHHHHNDSRRRRRRKTVKNYDKTKVPKKNKNIPRRKVLNLRHWGKQAYNTEDVDSEYLQQIAYSQTTGILKNKDKYV